MSGVILGALLGFLVCFAAWAVVMIMNDFTTPKTVHHILLIVFIASVVTGGYIEHEANNRAIADFISQKQSIEASLTDDRLTGFERAEIVKLASELNGELSQMQYQATKWYGFAIDDKVLEIEPILVVEEDTDDNR